MLITVSGLFSVSVASYKYMYVLALDAEWESMEYMCQWHVYTVANPSERAYLDLVLLGFIRVFRREGVEV